MPVIFPRGNGEGWQRERHQEGAASRVAPRWPVRAQARRPARAGLAQPAPPDCASAWAWSPGES